MVDYIDFGSVPSNEGGSLATDVDFHDINLHECNVFKKQLERLAESRNIPVGESKLVIKSLQCESGTYRIVSVKFNRQDRDGSKFASWLEANLPQQWDNAAKIEIAAYVCMSKNGELLRRLAQH